MELSKLEYLKILILSIAGWSIVLTNLMPFESIFLLLALISIGIFRRPLKEALNIPKAWFAVLLLGFVLLGIVPIFFYMPLGESSFGLIDHKMSAVVALLFIWVVFWQLKPSEDVIWWSLIFISFSIPFVIGYELYVLGDFNKIFTHRFGGIATPTVIRFGIYSNLFTVVLLGGFIWAIKRNSWTIVILIMAALLTFVGSLVSDTRSAWAGLPEALIAWAIFYWMYFKRNSTVNMKRVIALWIFFLVSFVAILFYFGDRVEKRWDGMAGSFQNYTDGSGRAGSVGIRLVLVEAGFKGFLAQPLKGVGQDNSISEQKRLTAPIMERVYGLKKGIAFGHLHNQYVEEAFTRGILGLLSLLLTIGYLILFFGKKIKESKQDGSFSPWPLAGLLFVISSSISMLGEAWIHLSTGVAFYMFFISLFVFISHSKTSVNHLGNAC